MGCNGSAVASSAFKYRSHTENKAPKSFSDVVDQVTAKQKEVLVHEENLKEEARLPDAQMFPSLPLHEVVSGEEDGGDPNYESSVSDTYSIWSGPSKLSSVSKICSRASSPSKHRPAGQDAASWEFIDSCSRASSPAKLRPVLEHGPTLLDSSSRDSSPRLSKFCPASEERALVSELCSPGTCPVKLRLANTDLTATLDAISHVSSPSKTRMRTGGNAAAFPPTVHGSADLLSSASPRPCPTPRNRYDEFDFACCGKR